MVDPDAGDFVHWVVYDIPTTVSGFTESLASPALSITYGLTGQNGFAHEDVEYRYGGPRPPSGVHTYRFTLYALNITSLGLTAGKSKAEVEAAMTGRQLGSAVLTGTIGP
jgi:hypothetical protein